MKPARYIFINRGLNMSPGKIAAQAAHAETLAMYDFMVNWEHGFELDPIDRMWTEEQIKLWNQWYGHGHYAKYVMKADDSTQMHTIERYIKDRGFRTYMVIDEGHTEETWMVPTAMSVELVDKDDERTTEVFSNFRMFREPRPEADTANLGSIDLASAGPFRRALWTFRA